MSRPLTPQEVTEKQSAMITDWMIDFINKRLLAEWNGINAFIKKEDVIKYLKTNGYNPQAFEDNGGLKFEALFNTAGWQVNANQEGWLFSKVKNK